MTLETLNHYAFINSTIEALEKDIENLYNPVKSPNGREVIGSFGGNPSNQTEENAIRAGELNDALDAKRKELLALSIKIEEWLRTVSDLEVEAIVRWRFKLCLSWRATSVRVYGYPNADRARKKLERFLKKSNSSETSAL